MKHLRIHKRYRLEMRNERCLQKDIFWAGKDEAVDEVSRKQMT